MANMQALLKKIAAAKPSGGGENISDGKYTFTVKKVILDEMYSGDCFIVELLVDEATKTHPDKGPNPVGSTCSFVQNFSKHPETAPGNVKAFILALLGVTDGDVSQEDFVSTIAHLVTEDQPARGMKISCETFRKNAKKSGTLLVLPKWRRFEQTAEDIKARKAQLDAA